ncbi:protein HEXIM1 [Trichomycterus rosablanca]|uniref:protein HEXIM1 n=1 Tax=Trichomycterus rosablanca TaxID=2290929 RepID=UPI002F350CEF
MDLSTEGAVQQRDSRGRQRADKQTVITEERVQRDPAELCPGPGPGPAPVYGETHPVCRARENRSLEPQTGDDAAEEKLSSEAPDGMNQGQSDGAPDSRHGKKKHRRRPSKRKRRWKPYFKLSWEEKRELDERESARASRVRAEMFAKGLPVAPYNTTQFLMEEHDREEPDLNTEPGARRSEDTASDEDCLEPDEDEDEDGEGGGGSDGMGRAGFLQRDFSETYERYHAETLQNMTKPELVREYLELEKSLSRLEEENNRLRRARRNSAAAASSDESAQRVRELESELERVRAVNAELLARCRQSAAHAHALNGSAPEPADSQ